MNTAPLKFVIVAALFVSACASTPDAPPPKLWETVADTHGFGGFGQVERIDFTFNVEIGDREISRGWSWEPVSGKVVYKGPGPDGEPIEHTYSRAVGTDMGTELGAWVDARFINDSFWLLFPLHLRWDSAAAVEVVGDDVSMPIGDARGTHLRMRYPADGGGYTPGDVYEVFVDGEGRVAQWIFKKGGSEENPRPATWADHQQHGPLLIAMDHRGPEGKFRLFFTGVEVTTRP